MKEEELVSQDSRMNRNSQSIEELFCLASAQKKFAQLTADLQYQRAIGRRKTQYRLFLLWNQVNYCQNNCLMIFIITNIIYYILWELLCSYTDYNMFHVKHGK